MSNGKVYLVGAGPGDPDLITVKGLDCIKSADVIMVARGDLGVELGDAELPGVQKRLIAEARAGNKIVITATQMMQSMITNSQPTRAEVLDVANAVLDGTDAVMLSAETAIGHYPVDVVQEAVRICEIAEKTRKKITTIFLLDIRNIFAFLV